ncbi:MAG: hypothetical protein AAF702_03090 [Chloroflexota bacterium]
MRQALSQLLILWVSLLIVGGLAFLILQTPAAREWMWQHTGEDGLLQQVKGLSDLASDLTRPKLALRPNAVSDPFVAELFPSKPPLPEPPVSGSSTRSPLGINVFLEQEADPAKRELAIKMAAEAGYTWLRQEFPWEDIEIHGKGDFEDRRHEPYRSAWQKYDHIVELAETYNMELTVRLSNPPSWTRAMTDTIGSYAPPDNIDDFADFVFAVVARYKEKVRFVQIWNEPNIYPEWGNYPISPEGYTEMLKAGAMAARTANADVVILAAALAATINLQPDTQPPQLNSLSDALFLQRMYDAGAAPYFDVVAVQGYGLYSGPTDQRMHPRVINVSRHQFIRDLMVQNGDAHKPIWMAEMNWNASPEDVPPNYGRVSLETQAYYLPLFYERLLSGEWPWVGVANTWYLKRATDEWEVQRRPEAYFRLLLPDFTPLPVYDSMVEFTRMTRE